MATICGIGCPPGSTLGAAIGCAATGVDVQVPNAVSSRVSSRTAERTAVRRKRAAWRCGCLLRARSRSSSLADLWADREDRWAGGRTARRFRAEAMGGTIADPVETFHLAGSIVSNRTNDRGRTDVPL